MINLNVDQSIVLKSYLESLEQIIPYTLIDLYNKINQDISELVYDEIEINNFLISLKKFYIKNKKNIKIKFEKDYEIEINKINEEIEKILRLNEITETLIRDAIILKRR